MVRISEFLPNPIGPDTSGEWLELENTSPSAVSIDGWWIANSNSKPKMVRGKLDAGSFLVLYRSQTKLTLKNNDEKIFLYDPQGILVDQASFSGSAPEGQSFSSGPAGFIVTQPTPGKPNQGNLSASLLEIRSFPDGIPLNPNSSWEVGIWAGLALGVAFAAVSVYGIKRFNDLSKLFF